MHREFVGQASATSVAPALARRLAVLTRRISAELAFEPDTPQLVVRPHVKLDDEQDAAIRAAIAA